MRSPIGVQILAAPGPTRIRAAGGNGKRSDHTSRVRLQPEPPLWWPIPRLQRPSYRLQSLPDLRHQYRLADSTPSEQPDVSLEPSERRQLVHWSLQSNATCAGLYTDNELLLECINNTKQA